MSRVLVSDSLSEAGRALFRAAGGRGISPQDPPGWKEGDLAAKIAGFEALVVRSASKVTRKVLEAASALKVVGRAGIGVDNVDVAAATERGVVVMNTPTANAVTTAEHAIALLLSLA